MNRVRDAIENQVNASLQRVEEQILNQKKVILGYFILNPLLCIMLVYWFACRWRSIPSPRLQEINFYGEIAAIAATILLSIALFINGTFLYRRNKLLLNESEQLERFVAVLSGKTLPGEIFRPERGIEEVLKEINDKIRTTACRHNILQAIIFMLSTLAGAGMGIRTVCAIQVALVRNYDVLAKTEYDLLSVIPAYISLLGVPALLFLAFLCYRDLSSDVQWCAILIPALCGVATALCYGAIMLCVGFVFAVIYVLLSIVAAVVAIAIVIGAIALAIFVIYIIANG